jgi:hypothetical protein
MITFASNITDLYGWFIMCIMFATMSNYLKNKGYLK